MVTAYVVPERGRDVAGLVRYLGGPGRHNEHTNQRVIAAADTLGVDDGTRLDAETIRALGRQLDSHRRAYGIEVERGHVWHCAISLPPGEALSDAQWAHVARTAVTEMGFTEASGHAPCRWVAVHHGQSTGGSEHIHLAVNLVREDGTVASTWRERKTMSRVCGQVEREFGLHVVAGRAGRGMPGYSRAEAERVRAGVRPEPDRVTLARTVRACATAAASEAEFVRRLRKAGVLARPRFAAGGRDAVIGYSVALRPVDGAAPVWMGGGRLAADLTLPKLRGHWTEMTPGGEAIEARGEALAEALAEWRHLAERRPPGAPGKTETTRYGLASWDQAAERIAAVRERLAAVPPGDTAAWSTAARQAAGILAGLSARLEKTPGPLAEAADALARSAQTRPGAARYARHSGLNDLRGVALVVRQATIPPHRPDPWITIIRQLIRLIDTIAAMHRQQHQAHQAAMLRRVAEDRLSVVLNTPVRRSAVDFPLGAGALPRVPRRPGVSGPVIDPLGDHGIEPVDAGGIVMAQDVGCPS